MLSVCKLFTLFLTPLPPGLTSGSEINVKEIFVFTISNDKSEGHAVANATSLKVAGSIPDEVIGFFN
jgi:hypothetical protein